MRMERAARAGGFAFALIVALALLTLMPTSARAAGAPTIAAAPVAAPGVLNVGDTRAGERFWRVQANPGDVLTISWKNNEALSTRLTYLCRIELAG